MAVAFDAATESVRTGTTDPHTFTHTPVGTPRAVVVTAVHGTESTQLISSITYGGVELASGTEITDTATEPGRAYIYHLGTGIPTGPQTVSIDLNSATTTDIQFVCMTFTASGDTSVQDFRTLGNNAANPSVTMQVGGLTSMAVAALYSGLGNLTDVTPLSGVSLVHDHDFGNFIAKVFRQTSVSSSNFTIGGTAATDDVALAALSITEVVSTKTIDLTGVRASGTASVSTADGVDVHVGPSAAAAAATPTAPILDTVAGGSATVALDGIRATATAAPATPDGLDKAIGVTTATATGTPTAPGVASSTGGGGTVTISLSGIEASATAAPAIPDGGDISVGPSAATASATSTAPPDPVSGGEVVTLVSAVAALATAVAPEEEPFPWGEDGLLPPALSIAVAVTAAEATADGSVPQGSKIIRPTQATADASVGAVLVGRPVQPPAAEATATASVPTEVSDSVAGASIAPQAAQASASITTPVVSVSIFAPQATADATGNLPAHSIALQHIAAQASAAGSTPALDVTIGAVVAVATASVNQVVTLKTGSAHIFATAATAIAACDRPRSVGVKNFVVLYPRPSEDMRTLVPMGATSTLTLTPMEEQIE